MEKEIGKYKIKFSGKFSDKSDKLELIVSIDDGLKAFLRGCISPAGGFQEVSINLGHNDKGMQENKTFKRHKIKTPVINSINYMTNNEVVFATDLLSKGKLAIDFNTFQQRDSFKTNFKEIIKKLLEISNNEKVSETVTFDVTVE